ncbi:het-domain-containing protein [Fusarium sporotrichioides]|uniref:Het-domain-containing protein n=1 Tax=Fusarium sporotrichioides TaxID=5514 RepID=A0A395RHH4_FUSSP|nr:het-domain-containing protein [Fusarium sporotrichioides]
MALVTEIVHNLCSVKPCSGDCDSSTSDSGESFSDSGSDQSGSSYESNSNSSELSAFDTKLGTNREISLRAGICILCRLIDRHIRRINPSSSGYVTICTGRSLVISSLPTDAKPQHTHTTVATIEYKYDDDDGPQNWIPGTWEVSRVLELQSLCEIFRTGDNRCQTQNRIGGRLIPDKVDFRLLRRWFQLCKSSHDDKCAHSAKHRGSAPRVMPAFVIDVQKACIVKAPPRCSYVALSYVWGASKVFMHLSSNTHLLMTAGSLESEDIPNTVRDAISATAGLHERFLWVDALCIVQDDPSMKRSQIEKVDQIYAGYGDSAAAGLPGVKMKFSEVRQEVLHLRGHTFLTVVGAYRSRETNYGEFEGPELALEEAHSNDLEIMPLEPEKGLPTDSVKASDYFALYCDYLQAYRRRNLSFKSDFLNAFQGIISVFSKTQKDEYFWGHPIAFFLASLGWLFESEHIRNFACQEIPILGKDSRNIEFPSWSWAAWDNQEQSGRELDFWSLRTLGRGFSEPSAPRPAITQFYIVTGLGKVIAIDERQSHHKTSSTTTDLTRLSWQGSDRDIPHQHLHDLEQNSKLVPGTLLFWASIATLRVRSAGSSASQSEISSFSGKTSDTEEQQKSSYEVEGKWKITGTGSDPFGEQLTHEAWLGVESGASPYEIILPGGPQLLGTFSAEFAAIYKDEKYCFDVDIYGKRSPKLMLLAIEWKQGLAYRIGLATGQFYVCVLEWLSTAPDRWTEETNNIEEQLPGQTYLYLQDQIHRTPVDTLTGDLDPKKVLETAYKEVMRYLRD